MVKIVKFWAHIIFEHPYKAISLMFETETAGYYLVLKLFGPGGHALPPPHTPILELSGYAPAAN